MYPCRGVLSSIEFSFTRKQKLIHLSDYNTLLQFYIVTLPIPYLSGSTVITFFNDISRFFNMLCIIDLNREFAQNFSNV